MATKSKAEIPTQLAIEAMARRMFEITFSDASIVSKDPLRSWDDAVEDYRIYWRELARAGIAAFDPQQGQKEETDRSPIEAMACCMFEALIAPRNVNPIVRHWNSAEEYLRIFWRKLARVGLIALRDQATKQHSHLLALRYENAELFEQINELRAENARLTAVLKTSSEGVLELTEKNVELGFEIVDMMVREAVQAKRSDE
jgi:hypothetical protein